MSSRQPFRSGWFVVVLFAGLCMVAVPALAVPNLISYQGQLNDQNGVPINATVAFIFSIYDVPTGGTALWTEAQTLPVSTGIFNVQLGAVTMLPSTVFITDTLYLGIKAGADPEMTPRQRITATAYSKKAELLEEPIVFVPVGGIVAWAKSSAGTPALPDGWVECNGQVLSDSTSPYNGTTIPNLNGASSGTKRFLRGSTTSGSIGGTETHAHSVTGHSNEFNSGGQWRPGIPGNTSTASTLPNYFEVVWIMRVK